MPKASDLSPEKRFFALFVGESGSGKTVAECSFPGPIQVDDFDGRIRGILGADWITDEMKTKISYDSYPPKMEGLIPALNKKLEVQMIQARNGQPVPTTWLCDSVTNMNYAFMCQAIPLTHSLGTGSDKKKGKYIGAISMPGPEDYGLEAAACYDYVAYLKSLPIPNVIVSAHIIDKFGKADPNNEYSDSVVVGEKLSIRDKISENIKTHFDHIFKFDRETINGTDRFYVTFRGGIARTSYSQLPNGKYDITGKDFYKELMKLTGVTKNVAA